MPEKSFQSIKKLNSDFFKPNRGILAKFQSQTPFTLSPCPKKRSSNPTESKKSDFIDAKPGNSHFIQDIQRK
jgi:hypothetical protein